jgi:hypothetical protein
MFKQRCNYSNPSSTAGLAFLKNASVGKAVEDKTEDLWGKFVVRGTAAAVNIR